MYEGIVFEIFVSIGTWIGTISGFISRGLTLFVSFDHLIVLCLYISLEPPISLYWNRRLWRIGERDISSNVSLIKWMNLREPTVSYNHSRRGGLIWLILHIA